MLLPTEPRILDEPEEILLYSARAAAKALGVCPRKLSEMTSNKIIPCVRIGWRVLYDPADLRAWIVANKGFEVATPRRDRSSETKTA